MSPNKKNIPSDKQHGSTAERKSNKRAQNQSKSAGTSQNERRISPVTGRGRATTQWRQRHQNLDRSTGRMTPPTERPDIETKSWNSSPRNQTTGSNVPGAEIEDRYATNPDREQHTSRDKYPRSATSSPAPASSAPDDQSGSMQERRYTGNSERSGQQYSAPEDASERVNSNMKSGHKLKSENDSNRQDTAPPGKTKVKGSNAGMLQQTRNRWMQPTYGVSNWMNHFLSEMNDFLDQDNGFSAPAINVREKNNIIEVDVAAPGMKKEDFKVEVDRDVLTISAESREEQEESDERYMRREFNYQNFRRSFWLSDQIDQNKIEANYDDGLLKVRIPKKAKEDKSKDQPKTINIV